MVDILKAAGVGGNVGDMAKGFAAGMVIDALQQALNKPKPRTVNPDRYSLSNYTAQLLKNGFRMYKGYYFTLGIDGQLPGYNAGTWNNEQIDLLAFNCEKINIPGWNAKTQVTNIYGLDFEVPVKMEQDPLWATFNIDIRNDVSAYFLKTVKMKTFGIGGWGDNDPNISQSPRYKDSMVFTVAVNQLDENFKYVRTYKFERCFFKTIQQIQLGSSETGIAQITAQIVYETMSSDYSADLQDTKNYNEYYGGRSKADDQSKAVYNPNEIKIGPFSADVSQFNLQKNNINKMPNWFSGPTKI